MINDDAVRCRSTTITILFQQLLQLQDQSKSMILSILLPLLLIGSLTSSTPAAADATKDDDVTTVTATNNQDQNLQKKEHKSCYQRVQNGECNSNPTYMIQHCLHDCFESKDFGTVGYYSNSTQEVNGNHPRQRIEFTNCVDLHEGDDEEETDSCQDMALVGECAIDPGYMIYNCAKSCLVCVDPGTYTFPIGIHQEIHPEDLEKDDLKAIQQTAQTILESFDYMQEIMTNPKYASIRTLCTNTDEYCSALAANGSCEMPDNYTIEDEQDDDDDSDDEKEENIQLYEFMMNECSAACQSCQNFLEEGESDIISDCIADPTTNIFGKGDLNRMFERIVGESDEGEVIAPKADVNVISRPSHPVGFQGNEDDTTDYVIGPWVVTIDNFLSDEECDRLVQLGSKSGYQRSTLEEEKDYDEEEITREQNGGEDAYRTSTNTWCENECYQDPITQRVIQKMSHATGIPDSYSEHLQLLRYVPGQYYKVHHDWIDDAPYQPSGPRILTFFLYLNDVEEGGATRLSDLTGDDGGIYVDVQPKKGRALIWPSVLDEDPSMMDGRTFHEALTVKKGRKFGANAWFHLRKYKDDECDYDAFKNVGQYDDAEEEDQEDEESSSSGSDEL